MRVDERQDTRLRGRRQGLEQQFLAARRMHPHDTFHQLLPARAPTSDVGGGTSHALTCPAPLSTAPTMVTPNWRKSLASLDTRGTDVASRQASISAAPARVAIVLASAQ